MPQGLHLTSGDRSRGGSELSSGLFVSDLDGTLLDRSGRLPETSRDALNALLDDGLAFTVASARSAYSMGPILKGLRLRLPVLEFNGAYLTDLAAGRVHYCRSLKSEIALDIVERGCAAGLMPVIATYDGVDQQCYICQTPNNPGLSWYLDDRRQARDPRLRVAVNPASGLAERLAGGQCVVCLTFIGRELDLLPLQQAIDHAWSGKVQTLCLENAYSPSWYWLTVHDALATKAHGLRALAEHLKIGLPQITVFGDGVNDLPMFKIAGRAVAVGNASVSVREMADEVIGDHEQDSVVRYLQTQTYRGALPQVEQ